MRSLRFGVVIASFICWVGISWNAYAAINSDCRRENNDWTATENRIWSALCLTGVSDNSSLAEKPLVRSKVLSELLRDETLTKPFHARGIWIKNIIVSGDLDLTDVNLDFPMRFTEIIFQGVVDLSGSKFGSNVSFSGSSFVMGLHGRRTKIEGSLVLGSIDREDAHAADAPTSFVYIDNVNAPYLTTGGGLYIVGAYIQNSVYVPYSHVGGSVDIENVDALELKAYGLNVAGQFAIRESTFSLPPTKFFGEPCVPQIISATGVAAQQQEHVATLNLYQMRAAQGIAILRSNVSDSIYLEAAQTDGNLNFSGTSLQTLKLNGVAIKGELTFGYNRYALKPSQTLTKWLGQSTIDLTNAKVGAIHAPQNTTYWPKNVVVRGLAINDFLSDFLIPEQQKLASIPSKTRSKFELADISCRFVHVFCNVDSDNHTVPPWQSETSETFFSTLLQRVPACQFTTEPYKSISSMLESRNEHDAAVEVGYAGKVEEMKRACAMGDILNCFVMHLSNVTIGFGYFLGRAIALSIIFVIAGAIIFRRTDEARSKGIRFGLAFSFDIFLPVVKLRDLHYEIDFTGPTRYYFYFHKLCGWILGSFVLAALSGLTK